MSHFSLAKKLLFFGILVISMPFISSASIVVLNGLTHESQVQLGETYRGVIQIKNASDENKSVRIYQRDYWFSYTGENKHDPAGTLERSNADWISFSPELVDLGPNEVISVNFEVKVPENSLSGSYWSVLMVEGIVPPDTTGVAGGVTINTAIRYAVQVITHIGTTGKSDIQFLGMDLEKHEDTPLLHVAIENTGERLLRPEVSLELFDEEGKSIGTFTGVQRKTYPGTSILVSFKLEGIKPGVYNGMLVADCDEDNVFGTNVSFEI